MTTIILIPTTWESIMTATTHIETQRPHQFSSWTLRGVGCLGPRGCNDIRHSCLPIKQPSVHAYQNALLLQAVVHVLGFLKYSCTLELLMSPWSATLRLQIGGPAFGNHHRLYLKAWPSDESKRNTRTEPRPVLLSTTLNPKSSQAIEAI